MSKNPVSFYLNYDSGIISGGLSCKGMSSWTVEHLSPEFIIDINHQVLLSSDKEFRVREIIDVPVSGIIHEKRICLNHSGIPVSVDVVYRAYKGIAVLEKWIEIESLENYPVVVYRADALSLNLPSNEYILHWFSSCWGKEFDHRFEPLAGEIVLQSTKGRSSAQTHPWFALTNETRGVLSVSIAWSGNWKLKFEPLQEGNYLITGGINPWKFSKSLKKGNRFESPHALIAFGEEPNLDSAAVQMQRWWRRAGIRKKSEGSCLVEWNHWWAYEDGFIDEDVFKRNADIAAELEMEVCVLDAGWFGSQEGISWVDVRGDWNIINTKRFPNGLRAMSEYVKNKGMKFGLWCEIEAVGDKANLQKQFSLNLARCDGRYFGSVCLGNPDSIQWAFDTLDKIITGYKVDWLKLDFNLNPGAGCNRTDHGHGEGDGLYEHYQGLYILLSKIREKHPKLLIENCSSGGLRIDAGIMRCADMAYLSDPDMPVHSLQVFWGATMMLPPDMCLHWIWSHSRGCFNPLILKDAVIEQHRLDYYCHISMLNILGFSHPLPEIPQEILRRLKENILFYKQRVRRFILKADLFHLTEQPRRNAYRGRIIAFEYLMPEKDEALVFIFRTPGSLLEKQVFLKGLIENSQYKLESIGNYYGNIEMNGQNLISQGLDAGHLREEESLLLFLELEK